MNVEEILRRTRLVLDDTVQPYLWDDFELISYLNDAQDFLCAEAHLIVDSTTRDVCRIGLVSGQPKYQFHEKIVDIKRVKLNSTKRRLTRVTQQVLDFHVQGWEDENGTPRFFLDDADEGYLQLYKTPSFAETSKAISTITQANPCKVTTSSEHGLSTGDAVRISGVGGMTELNDKFFIVTKVDDTNVTLDVDSTNYTTYTSGGNIIKSDMLLMTVARLPLTQLTIDDMNVEPEINARHHSHLIDGILGLAFGKEDVETYDKEKSLRHLRFFYDYVSEQKRANLLRMIDSRKVRKLMKNKFDIGSIMTPQASGVATQQG